MQKNNIKIAVTYEWEIDRMDWSELKAHQKTIENELEMKLEYDPTFMFHVFSDISVPSLKQLRLNGKVRKVKLG